MLHRFQLLHGISLLLLGKFCTLSVTPYTLTLFAFTLIIAIIRTFFQYLLHLSCVKWILSLLFILLFLINIWWLPSGFRNLKFQSDQVDIKEYEFSSLIIFWYFRDSLTKLFFFNIVLLPKYELTKSLAYFLHVLLISRAANNI